ncbi:UNVERIFIED_CONTAM: MBG domain-containing protein, partial [Pseudomonas aeruginosa]
VIADGKTKVYGDADPALTYQVSGLKNGDTAGAVLNGGSLSRV